MENELFVVWMIKMSPRARAVAGQIVGDLLESDMLRRLGMASVQGGDQLGLVAASIHAEFAPPRLPAAFTVDHLPLLVDAGAVPRLARVLGCAPSEVFEELFDTQPLAQVLQEPGRVKGEILDAELLVLKLLQRLPRLAVRHGLEPGDWGPFIERRGWLKPTAIRRLADHGELREWPLDARPTQILAGVLEGVGIRTDFGSSPRLDALGLIELRRRVGLLTEQLRVEAADLSDEAAQLAPDLTSVSRLSAWLELYESKAVAGGLLRLFTGATSIGDLLEGCSPTSPEVTGTPVANEALRIDAETFYGVWRRRVSFDVVCPVEGREEPQVVLRCRGLRQDSYEPVREAIGRLRGGDLAGVGRTVGERLLNTQVAQHEGLRGRLRRALQEHGAAVIWCVILTGLDQPITIPSPWHDHLSARLPYDTPPAGDALLPDLAHVNRTLRESAAGRPIEVTR